jgi:NAD(P)-dependent dehydrogenase (short-subunit alcohol dehydrogenase family)
MPTWFITGCSTGLGRHLAKAVLQRGWNAVVSARDPASVDDLVAQHHANALALQLDVTDQAQIDEGVRRAIERFGAIDVLVNNAGYGYRAAVEEAAESDVRRLFETNLFGAIALTRGVLPYMRAQRRGAIVNISSIAAYVALAGSAYYASTKSALEAISDGLRREVEPLGIKVLVVEPGAFRTDFSGRSLLQSATVIDDYAQTAGLRRKEHDTMDGRQPGDPDRAAQAIIDTLQAEYTPFRLVLGTDAVAIARRTLEAQLAEIEAWEAVSAGTDFAS